MRRKFNIKQVTWIERPHMKTKENRGRARLASKQAKEQAKASKQKQASRTKQKQANKSKQKQASKQAKASKQASKQAKENCVKRILKQFFNIR